jgi:hypothetical protein
MGSKPGTALNVINAQIKRFEQRYNRAKDEADAAKRELDRLRQARELMADMPTDKDKR